MTRVDNVKSSYSAILVHFKMPSFRPFKSRQNFTEKKTHTHTHIIDEKPICTYFIEFILFVVDNYKIVSVTHYNHYKNHNILLTY